ncbi:MAG TPA: transporter substrate-binding domain-containing protein [Anaeromyxobacteraceae bacterium]|nr:transporter substrate-binding domain-containing protein [Anaeromyxobacteraceae bacterium]
MSTRAVASICAALALLLPTAAAAGGEAGGDLAAVKSRGVLRHLGIPYANFVTGSGDGFDVELMRLFAARLGVRYEFVETDWPAVLPDLTGRSVSPALADLESAQPVPIRGDVVATGLTMLKWRASVISFSSVVFPTQVWVLARAGSPVQPIKPSQSLPQDIARVKALLDAHTLLGIAKTCLDPTLYGLEKTKAKLAVRKVRLDEIAPLLIQGEAELALLDVADAMIALQKWPGKIKVIGPISERQEMGVAFRKDAPRLHEAFEAFLAEAHRDGTYRRLVQKYFPEAPVYFPDFFTSGGRS